MKRIVAIPVVGIAAAVAACSGKTGVTSQPGPSGSAASSGIHGAPTHVGGTLNLAGEGEKTIGVTLSKIIDPATGTDGPPVGVNGNLNGSRYVAALLTLKNTGTAPIQDDANNNAVLVGSNNQDYLPDNHKVTECTNFNQGIYRLDANESVSGCVTFVMPPKVTPAKFKYTPKSGFMNTFGEWLIP